MRKNGYTIIELIIVLIVITILLSLANFSRGIIKSRKEKMAITIFYTNLKNYRQEAVLANVYRKIVVKDESTYLIYDENNNIINREKLGENLKFDRLNCCKSVYFSHDFSSVEAGTFTIVGRKDIYTITISPITGNVQVR
ncbi:MAG: prepilin-type N-terminal cleavage/methylation domain-containing protein [Tissierellia bacterium]|nr:prepilin-type N-terminal cleavage/methylation domain-containing protein [Tissierellia bacterium]